MNHPDNFGLRARREPHLLPAFLADLARCVDDSLALFDADGTLWVNDVADDFTSWMIARGHVPGENWPTYLQIYRDDHPAGCRYLLSFFAGMTRQQLQVHVDDYWQRHARRQWIGEVVETLRHLADLGYPIWVLSGTPTDFLLPLRQLLPVSEVVGMDFELDPQGVITGKHAGISCAGEGKAEKLRSLIGQRPIKFACGNGSLDGPMMELAELAWSVYPNSDFAAYSRAHGWPILSRPADFLEEEKFR